MDDRGIRMRGDVPGPSRSQPARRADGLRELDPELGLELVRITEVAAVAADRWVGRGAEHRAHDAARAAAGAFTATLPLRGRAVWSGRDGAAPPVGTGEGPPCDVLVEPLDAARWASRGARGALSALAVTTRGGLLAPTPIGTVDALAAGSRTKDLIDLGRPLTDNVRAVAAGLGRPVSATTVAVLDRRDRSGSLGRAILDIGARLPADDIEGLAAALALGEEDGGVDLLVGVGDVRRAILVATVMACTGGAIQVRARPAGPHERSSAVAAGRDVDAILHTADLVCADDAIFCATGVTDGPVLGGVSRCRSGAVTTHSLTMHARSGARRVVHGHHQRRRLDDLLGLDVAAAPRPPVAHRTPRIVDGEPS